MTPEQIAAFMRGRQHGKTALAEMVQRSAERQSRTIERDLMRVAAIHTQRRDPFVSALAVFDSIMRERDEKRRIDGLNIDLLLSPSSHAAIKCMARSELVVSVMAQPGPDHTTRAYPRAGMPYSVRKR